MQQKSNDIGILHVPVVHDGIMRIVREWGEKRTPIYIPNASIVKQHQRCRDIRALSGKDASTLINGVTMSAVINFNDLMDLPQDPDIQTVHCGSDEVSSGIAHAYRSRFPTKSQPEIQIYPAFLQWDRNNVFTQHPVSASIGVSFSQTDLAFMRTALAETDSVSDWWRRVGAVAIRDGKIITTAHNQHLPTQCTPYINGDPRDACEPGQNSELCSAIHAEQALIAQVAKNGLSLSGASLYITTFPCPVCAKLIAAAGIKKIYYHEGHASLDVPEIFQAFGIEVIHVIID